MTWQTNMRLVREVYPSARLVVGYERGRRMYQVVVGDKFVAPSNECPERAWAMVLAAIRLLRKLRSHLQGTTQ